MKATLLYLQLLLSSTILFSAQIRYTGGNNEVWSNSNNWENGTIPGSGDLVWLDGNSGTPSTVDQNTVIGGFYFTGSSSKTVRIADGVFLDLLGYQVGEEYYLVRHLGNSGLTINAAAVSDTGVLRLLSSGIIHVDNATRTFSIDRKISEVGESKIIKTGAGILNLLARSQTSDYSGGIELREGALYSNISSLGVANNPTSGPLGTGVLTFAGGQFVYTGSTDGVYHNHLEATGDIHIGNSDPEGSTVRRSLVFMGDLDLKGGSRVLNTNQVTTGGVDRTTEFSGVISNGGLIKRGVSSVSLSGVNQYEGETVIEQGILRINASGSIAQSSAIVIHEQGVLHVTNSYELSSGQVLSGEGTVLNRLRLGEGILAPGMEGIGRLNVDADVWFSSGTIRFELGDGVGDQIVMSSSETRSLSGNSSGGVSLEFTGLEGFLGGEFILIDTSGLLDPNLSNWGVEAFSVSIIPSGWDAELFMDGNNVNVRFSQIPEPAYFSIVLLGLLFFLRRSRK